MDVGGFQNCVTQLLQLDDILDCRLNFDVCEESFNVCNEEYMFLEMRLWIVTLDREGTVLSRGFNNGEK